jgi:uncharacterized membrane protein
MLAPLEVITMAIPGLMIGLNIFYSILLIGTGLVMAIIAYPLVKRKIKMNHMYGVRFPQSFYSEESWYKINEYGGKLLMIWGILIAIAGICLMFIRIEDWVGLLIFLALIASLIVPVDFTYRYAKSFEPTAR